MLAGAISNDPVPQKLKLPPPSMGDGAMVNDGANTQDKDQTSPFSSFVDNSLQTNPISLAVYILGSLGAVLAIVFHRRCPSAIKNVDMFAAKHWVEDTHALRMLDTKLGAGFTIALLFVISCILAFVADPINNFVKTSGLEPGIDTFLDEIDDYSKITIGMRTFAPQPNAQCDAIQYQAPDDVLTCFTTIPVRSSSKHKRVSEACDI